MPPKKSGLALPVGTNTRSRSASTEKTDQAFAAPTLSEAGIGSHFHRNEARVDRGDKNPPRARLRIAPRRDTAVRKIAVVAAQIDAWIVIPALDAGLGIERNDAAEWRCEKKCAVDKQRRCLGPRSGF